MLPKYLDDVGRGENLGERPRKTKVVKAKAAAKVYIAHQNECFLKCDVLLLLFANNSLFDFKGAAVSASQAQAASSTTSLDADLQPPRRPWRLKPSVRRQARLELDVPAPENVGDLGNATSPSRDHGLRTPPGPPVQLRPRRPTTLGEGGGSQRYATHLMASDMTGLLAPPSRTAALARAHTDPTSSCYENQPTPNSPPPTYEEVMKEVT